MSVLYNLGMNIKCTCTTVRKANRAIFRFYEETMSESPLSVTQFAIVRSLQRNGPTPLSQLAEEMVMERTSLYRTIRPLEDLKAVRIYSAKQGKAKIAELTKKGEKLTAEAEPYWNQAQQTMVNLIGKKEWINLQTALLKIPDLISNG